MFQRLMSGTWCSTDDAQNKPMDLSEMTQLSRIEWTEATWNPTTGCTKVSAGCKNCYNASLKKFLFSLNNGAAQTKKIPVDF